MSKILRRPMFRGGRVDSRGSGITSGLGYAGGGQVTPKRGLVDGPGGYAGRNTYASTLRNTVPAASYLLSSPRTVNQPRPQPSGLDGVLAGINKPTTGADLLKLNPNLQINPYSTYLPSDTESVGAGFGFLEPESQFTEEALKYSSPKEQEYETFENESGDVSYKKDAQGNLIPIQKNGKDFKTFLEEERVRKLTANDPQGSEEQYGITEKDKVVPILNKKGEITGYKGTETEKIKQKQVTFSNTGDGDASTVDENDLESLISRYEELLGGKKARQRDVGDMLGRASAAFLKKGARGEDRGVTDALGDFMAAESASGPSRTEKINNAAAMLGIKGEQAQKLYETKLKNVKGQFSQRVDEIMKTQGVSRPEALRLSLGKPANMGEAFIAYSQKVGRPPQPIDFDALAETFTEGPLPVPFTEATGTFYIPGQMTIVKMVQGKQKGSKKYK